MKSRTFKLRIKRREVLTTFDAVKISVFSTFLAFLAFSVVLWQAGADPLQAYAEMFLYGFTTSHGLELTFHRTAFMLLVTLAFILPLKAGLWNIGATSQVYVGMIMACGISYIGRDLSLPSGALIPLMVIGAAVFAGGLSMIVGYLKGKLNVNEIVVTVMFNSIMLYLVKYLIEGPWRDPAGVAQSDIIPPAGRFPMIGETAVPYTIFLAVGMSIIFLFILAKTTIGFEIRTYGENPTAARISGISFTKVAVITMFLGGAMAGIAGLHQTAGVPGMYRITTTFMDNAGMWAFYGIVFGLMCRLNPVAAILPSLFFSGVQVGSRAFETRLGVAYGANLALVGILMIILVAGQVLYRLRISWKEEK